MIINFQVIPTRHGDQIYTLDDQGVLRVKQPQQTWREVPAVDSYVEPLVVLPDPKRSVAPLHSEEEIKSPRPSILDGYTF